MSAHPLSRRLPLAATVALALVGCTVGPNYQAIEPPIPETLGRDSRVSGRVGERAAVVDAEIAWWQSFQDPVLSELVERAASSNLELEVALARVEEARAARRAQGGRLWPAVNARATGGRSKASVNGPGPLSELAEAGLASLENELFTFGFEAAWELDLFGRVRRAREASQARLEGAEESFRGAVLLVAAETAGTYIELRGAERRLALAERNLGIQEESLEVIDAKVESGLLAPIDRERTTAQRASLHAALAPLRAARAAAEYRLAVLVGELPHSLEDVLGGPGLEDQASVPVPPAAIAAGLPADLLWRRPDLRAAEREFHAATAEVGVAIGDRLPRITIGGSRGQEAARLSDLFKTASRTWSFGPQIDLPIFRGGQLKAGVEAARARLAAASASYRQAVLAALAEVEANYVAYEEAGQALQSLQEAAAASSLASEYAEVLYDEGLRDHLVLLDAQRSQTASDDALARAETDYALRAVLLYRALGGGWQALEELAFEVAATSTGQEESESSNHIAE